MQHLSLTYFTKHNIVYVHPRCWRWQNFVVFYGWGVVHWWALYWHTVLPPSLCLLLSSLMFQILFTSAISNVPQEGRVFQLFSESPNSTTCLKILILWFRWRKSFIFSFHSWVEILIFLPSELRWLMQSLFQLLQLLDFHLSL